MKKYIQLYILALISLGIYNSSCVNKNRSDINFKVGDFCKVKEFCYTAENDSLYDKINEMAHMQGESSLCDTMFEACTAFLIDEEYEYKVISIGDIFSKIEYIDLYGKKHIVKVKTNNLVKSDGIKYDSNSSPIRITKDSLAILETKMRGYTSNYILGEFKLNMSKSEYIKICERYEENGIIYQWANDGEMAYTLKSGTDRIEINLYPKYKNNRLIELRGVCWNLEGGFPAIEQYFRNKYGNRLYQNGHDNYWISNGIEIILRFELVPNGPYPDEHTYVFYIKQL